MYMAFSFEEGRPVAQIVGGKNDGKILHVYDPSEMKNCCKKCNPKCWINKKKKCCKNCPSLLPEITMETLTKDPMDILGNDFYQTKGRRRINVMEMETLRRAIMRDEEPLEVGLAHQFTRAKSKLKEEANKSVILHDAIFIPLPNPDKRECGYVCAPSGSGKTTWIANYARAWKEDHPNENIYIFSRLEEDQPLDDLEPIRIAINDELIEDPISPEEFKNSLVIFDDTDTIPDKELKNAVTAIKNDILETGRHHNVYTLISSHLINNYKETRTVLNESNFITIFPSCSGRYQISYALKNYYGLSPDQIKRIFRIKSRWVTIYRGYPMFVLSEHECYLLN